MSYRLANSLVALRNQTNALYPLRSKASDGWIGDTSHAARKSDHNPNIFGVVCAIDLTNDPAHGLVSDALAEKIRVSKDPRLNYVISKGRIATISIQGGAWRPYTGTNKHDKHCHISAKQDSKLYDQTGPWPIGGALMAQPLNVPVVLPAIATIKKGSKGPDVTRVQTLLNTAGASPQLLADGEFGVKTETAVKAFQKAYGIVKDGTVYMDAASGKTLVALLKIAGQNQAQADHDRQPANAAGANFDRIVMHYEGRVVKVYRIDGRLHGGYGHQLADNAGFKEGDVVSDAQVQAWYVEDKANAESLVRKKVTQPLTQGQFDAVCSIIWNGGASDDPTDKHDSPFYYKTKFGILANALNIPDYPLAKKIIVELGSKPTATGQVFKGIINRRLTEGESFDGLPIILR